MIAGLLVLLMGGVRFTARQEVVRVGHATVTAPAASVGVLPRLAGAALLATGVTMLGASARRRRRPSESGQTVV
jgi:hypothetical protein